MFVKDNVYAYLLSNNNLYVDIHRFHFNIVVLKKSWLY